MASPFVELEVGSRTVKVTNPDKVLFPDAGHTKRDLVDYYLAVGDGIVRALRERPTQLRRFPDGIEGEQIYQKRVPQKRPEWVEVAGCVILDLESPTFAKKSNTRRRSIMRRAASGPPSSLTANIAPEPRGKYLRAKAWYGLDGSEGYATELTAGWASRKLATAIAFSACRSMRRESVSSPCKSRKALIGSNCPPSSAM